MYIRKAIARSMLVCAALSGCVPMQPFNSALSGKQSLSSKADLRRAWGRPTDIRFTPDAEEIWEYARGPMGRQTFIARIGRDGRVLDVKQVLTEAHIAQLRAGYSTSAQVRALLGRPGDVAFYSGTGAEVWEYRILDDASRTARILVQYDGDGVVREIGKIVDTPGGVQGHARDAGKGDGKSH
jgi:hypothetical protein